jgi:DNA (cytosine-5)-methyltransferase 1
LVTELIVDQDEEAMAVYAANHGARQRVAQSVSRLLDFAIKRTTSGAVFPYPPELTDDVDATSLADIDLVLAGPPCQGHSNLNNHTRRDDPRNDLYLTVPAFTVAIGAPICIIENVPAILNDPNNVVGTARELFQHSGYQVTDGTLSAAAMGWPQTRKRHFLVARKQHPPMSLDLIAEILAEDEGRSAWWAIGDLEDCQADSVMDQRTELSPENVERVSWLFDNDAHDLALPERPKSHRNGTSYTAVYGRMYADRPAQTITTGFMSPGRGRYIHPTRRRVITAHEAARLQGFPDDYVFVPDPRKPPSRAKLAKWIGDAVPMPLGYAAAVSALAGGVPTRVPPVTRRWTTCSPLSLHSIRRG